MATSVACREFYSAAAQAVIPEIDQYSPWITRGLVRRPASSAMNVTLTSHCMATGLHSDPAGAKMVNYAMTECSPSGNSSVCDFSTCPVTLTFAVVAARPYEAVEATGG